MTSETKTDEVECEHPKEAREMRGWTEVCTLCGLGRRID